MSGSGPSFVYLNGIAGGGRLLGLPHNHLLLKPRFWGSWIPAPTAEQNISGVAGHSIYRFGAAEIFCSNVSGIAGYIV